jgi:hypothetical protein
MTPALQVCATRGLSLAWPGVCAEPLKHSPLSPPPKKLLVCNRHGCCINKWYCCRGISHTLARNNCQAGLGATSNHSVFSRI